MVFISCAYFLPSLAASERIYFALLVGIFIILISIGKTGFICKLIG